MTSPLVLAGPIVRRCEPDCASVFVALSAPQTVTLELFDPDSDTPIALGEAHTVQLGDHIHAVVVSAHADPPLAWGTAYAYTLHFDDAHGQRRSLDDAGVLDRSDYALYDNQTRPSFVLPPEQLTSTCLLHGSCRKAHGHGEAAMGVVEALLHAHFESGSERPHLLCLTGDQIYADDVQLELLAFIEEVMAERFGTAERDELEGLGHYARPGARAALLKDHAKLTSSSAKNHLISLSDYVGMMLVSWSPALWLEASEAQPPQALMTFAHSLDAVQRALAHIATYTIFDDHEVTDDWYLNGGWTEGVLKTSLGRRVVRNALATYAVFQAWGNDPRAFDPGTPGGRLLKALDGWDGTTQDTARIEQIDRLLGIPAASDLPKHTGDALINAPGRLDYTWVYHGPTWNMIGFDTRTRRVFHGKTRYDLMSTGHMDEAVARLSYGDPECAIVLSAGPVLGVKRIEIIQNIIAKTLGPKAASGLDNENWHNSSNYKALLERLFRCAPVLVLSGDVHYGFAASARATKGPLKGERIINFTSSSFQNETEGLAKWALSHLTGGHHMLKSLTHAPPTSPNLEALRTAGAETNEAFEIDETVFGLDDIEEDTVEDGLPMPKSLSALKPKYARTYLVAENNIGVITWGDDEVTQELRGLREVYRKDTAPFER